MDPITSPLVPPQLAHRPAQGPQATSKSDSLAQETSRVRELYKYFLATSQAIGYGDIDSQDGYNPQFASLSTDPVLNGLAQLAVFRLAGERAFISLIDHEHQFVITEATREISLYDADVHPPGQGLCIGARPLDLSSGVCAATMPAFIDGTAEEPCISTENIYADTRCYIINDFTLEDMYKDRPYVAGFPFMRYYAEVPLKTSSGYVIGTLAVVDNKPRKGLDSLSYRALTEISATIMRHLEKIKVDQDYQQASTLLRGFNNFLISDALAHEEPAGNSHDEPDAVILNNTRFQNGDFWERENPKQPRHSVKELALGSGLKENSSSTNLRNAGLYQTTPGPETRSSLDLETTTNPTSWQSHKSDVEHTISSSVGAIETDISDVLEDAVETPYIEVAASDAVRGCFSKAAHVLRQAMDLDGVIFLDAALSDFASRSDLATSQNPFSSIAHEEIGPSSAETSDAEPAKKRDRVSNSLNISASDPSWNEQSAVPNPAGRARSTYRMSARLAISISSPINTAENVITSSHCSIPDDVHRGLLRRYPKGHIFKFDNEKDSDSNKQLPDENSPKRGSKSRQRVMSRRDIDTAIKISFPNVRSAIFYPLWNARKQAWCAGTLAWTNRRRRVFQRDDLIYLSVFGNSIIAEVTRLELVASDRAKSDFISSISHELRSPLHGILGSAELLRETATDSNQQDQMVTMIEHCGRTMLDTMDHILDFSKISSKGSKGKKYSRKSGKPIRENFKPLHTDFTSIFELDKVVEETVESLVAGHRYNIAAMRQFSGSSHTRSYAAVINSEQPGRLNSERKDLVNVIVDIESRSSWYVNSDLAAWRRIILNLIGNSLKYTESGLVEVLLQTTASAELNQDLSDQAVTLMIRDTGCGISKSYLLSHLYTPFVQENDLSNGTGLGLSIVQKVVHDLQGTINVQSELGSGTQVDVSMPVTFVSPPNIPVNELRAKKATVCLLGFDIYPDLNIAPTGILPVEAKIAIAIKNTLENCAKHWCGLSVISASEAQNITADVLIVGEKSLHLLQSNKNDNTDNISVQAGSSVIIVAATENEERWYNYSKSDRMQYLAQPFGPLKVTQAITAAVNADRAEAFLPFKTSEAPQDTRKLGKKSRNETTEPSASATDAYETKRDNLSRPNLLLVDDNSVNLTMLSAIAKRLECRYSTAGNGKEAVDIFCTAGNSFEYVLMDVSMPVMDGFAAARAIRDFENTHTRRATPIIALTGLGSISAQQEAYASGMDMFLTKPVPMTKIKALVEQGLEGLALA